MTSSSIHKWTLLTYVRNSLVKYKSFLTDLNVKETEENEAVVNTMRDLHRLVSSRYLPAVQSWIQVNLHSFNFLTENHTTANHILTRLGILNFDGALLAASHVSYKCQRKAVIYVGPKRYCVFFFFIY